MKGVPGEGKRRRQVDDNTILSLKDLSARDRTKTMATTEAQRTEHLRPSSPRTGARRLRVRSPKTLFLAFASQLSSPITRCTSFAAASLTARSSSSAPASLKHSTLRPAGDPRGSPTHSYGIALIPGGISGYSAPIITKFIEDFKPCRPPEGGN